MTNDLVPSMGSSIHEKPLLVFLSPNSSPIIPSLGKLFKISLLKKYLKSSVYISNWVESTFLF